MKPLLMILFLALSAYPQDYEYGKPSDLQRLKRVYIDTGADLKSRDKIINKLKQAKLDLVFPDTADEAEILITYRAGSDRKTVGVPTSSGTMIAQPDYPYGVGVVLVSTAGKPKLVFSFHDQQNTAFEKAPLTNFTRELVKLFKANH